MTFKEAPSLGADYVFERANPGRVIKLGESDPTIVRALKRQLNETLGIQRDPSLRLDAGVISGLAEWCRLDWESHFFSRTRAARQKRMSDTQVAFISVLHGAAQGRIFDAMESSGACNAQDKLKVEKMLNQSKASH